MLVVSQFGGISPAVTGSVRYHGRYNRLEVMDNDTWREIATPTTTVSLTPELQGVIKWAKDKMTREQEEATLCDRHPGLRELRDQYNTLKILCTTKKETA